MQNTELISNEKVRNLFSNINSFFDFFGVDKILRQSNIKKVRGARVLDILTKMMELPFLGMNYYRGIVINKESGLDKMAGYDLVNNPHYNWRKLLLRLVYIVINQFLRPLTDDSREDVL